ncbi:hypothetical protein [Conexibacter sp. SYSU D00693]|uniref:DUF459 domain-containing protein n=1 Tax=Conexibacter sp. SYSU D00693 TaxID=2812560 RepID=UPI001F11DC9E|nr:hypothetical protein [Conexibacter sp. SYSU D00693]
MRMTRARKVGGATAAAIALAAGAVAATGTAPAQTPPAEPESLLTVGVGESYVKLAMFAPTGSLVRFVEEVGGTQEPLGEATAALDVGRGDVSGAYAPVPIPWRCDRTVRYFKATAFLKDGRTIEATNQGRTPDCRDRISVTTRSRVQPGSRVRIKLKDRWQLGDVKVKVCTHRAGGGRQCSTEVFKAGQRAVSVTRDAGSRVGLLDLDVAVGRFHQRQQVGVGRAAPKVNRPRLLVAGDSMMQGIGAILAEKLRSKYLVSSVIRSGSGVAKDIGKPWTTLAREQATKLKPAVTVVLLGGTDSIGMTTPKGGKVECCGEPWRKEYFRRVDGMADAWGRDGQGKVVWALLPASKFKELDEGIAAVNDVLRRVAARRPKLKLVPLDAIFGTTWQEEIDGVKVRDPDGLHFSLPGQRIAANAFLKALRG